MEDFNDNMQYFQDQITARGISIEELNMNDYAGLTKNELQYIVDHAETFRHAPAPTKKQLYTKYKADIETLKPLLVKYGFSLHLTEFGFTNMVPACYAIEDNMSYQKFWFDIYTNSKTTPIENFLAGLKAILQYKKPDKPEIYNRLKGLYFTTLDTMEP